MEALKSWQSSDLLKSESNSTDLSENECTCSGAAECPQKTLKNIQFRRSSAKWPVFSHFDTLI